MFFIFYIQLIEFVRLISFVPFGFFCSFGFFRTNDEKWNLLKVDKLSFILVTLANFVLNFVLNLVLNVVHLEDMHFL